jgi:hypothetical protein
MSARMRSLMPVRRSGVTRVLAFDLPDTVTMMRDSDVERFGGPAALREAGLANLRAVPMERTEQVTAEDGVGFDLVTGKSVYTASLALILPDVLGRLDDAEPGLLEKGIVNFRQCIERRAVPFRGKQVNQVPSPTRPSCGFPHSPVVVGVDSASRRCHVG